MSDERVPFSDLVRINPRTPPNGSNTVPFISMTDVSDDGNLLSIGRRTIPAAYSGLPAFIDGDVLFAKITPCMENGKGAIVSGLNGETGHGSTEFHVLRALPHVEPRFIYHWTMNREFRRRAELMMVGSGGQRRVPAEFFRKFLVLRPPLMEQQRIVEVLDSVSEVERAIEASIAKLRTVQAAVTGELLNQFTWDTHAGTVLTSLRNGHSPTETQQWTGVQMLGLGCLTPDGYSPRQLKNAPPSVSPSHAARLRDGDLLVSRANTRDLVGLAGIYRESTGTPCIYPDLMMRIQPKHCIRAEFLELCLRSPRARRKIMAMAQGTSESMVKISSTTIKALRIPAPSTSDQDRVLAAAHRFRERISMEHNELAKLRKLRQGLADDLLTGRVSVRSLG